MERAEGGLWAVQESRARPVAGGEEATRAKECGAVQAPGQVASRGREMGGIAGAS